MKEQIAVAVTIPSTIVNLTLDFHGLSITMKQFDTTVLEGGSTLYLAVDECGDLSAYQYEPNADLKCKDFDPGAEPDNAINAGYYDLVTEIDTDELPVAWDESVIKYTITKESV